MDIVNHTLDVEGAVIYLTATYSTVLGSYRETGEYVDRAEAITAALETDEYVLKVQVEELGRARNLT